MSGKSRQVQVITREYEQWMTARLPFVINKHLNAKHKRMAGRGSSRPRKAAPPPFAFLRATFYLWAVRVPEHIGDLLTADGPRVVGIGDVHLENFGTWRDAEGRLVRGANDIDEATRMPNTNDLIRLATSATLAGLKIDLDRIADDITRGYREALRTGPCPPHPRRASRRRTGSRRSDKPRTLSCSSRSGCPRHLAERHHLACGFTDRCLSPAIPHG